MSLYVGNTEIKDLYYGNKSVSAYCNGEWIWPATPPIPPVSTFTLRMQYKPGTSPSPYYEGATVTQVTASPNVWDVTYNNTDWSYLMHGDTNLIAVLDANTTGVISMASLFDGCTDLETIVLFDTSSVTAMDNMFLDCHSLTSVPLFNTSSVTSMWGMFHECWAITSLPSFNVSNVGSIGYICCGMRSLTALPNWNFTGVFNCECAFAYTQQAQSGITTMYNRLKNTADNYVGTFFHCGDNTTAGAAELAQIPSSWKSNPW